MGRDLPTALVIQSILLLIKKTQCGERRARKPFLFRYCNLVYRSFKR